MVTLEQMRRAIDRREAERRARNRARWEAARKDLDAVVAMIRDEFAPARITVWGSLLDPSRFNEMSDLDVAVEGVTDPERYFALLGRAAELTELPVDIVQLDRIDPIYADLIRRKGKVVYERP